MLDTKTLVLVATTNLLLAACSPPAGSGDRMLPPPPEKQFSSVAKDEQTAKTKTFDMNEDGTVTAGEAVGGVVLVGGFLALCPICVLGM